MDRELVGQFVSMVEELLGALARVEVLGTTSEVVVYRNRFDDVSKLARMVRKECGFELDLPIVHVPEAYAVPVLGDGIPVAPVVGDVFPFVTELPEPPRGENG